MNTKWQILKAGSPLGDGFTAWEYLNNQLGVTQYVYGETELALPASPPDIAVTVDYRDLELELRTEGEFDLLFTDDEFEVLLAT